MKKILYFGPTWEGSTSLQRAKAFSEVGNEVLIESSGSGIGKLPNVADRIMWKLRLPRDIYHENQKILDACGRFSPDFVIVDNSKVIKSKTVRLLKKMGVKAVSYYTPDDIMGSHNLSFYLKWSLAEWDVVFVTKSFNIPELKAHGVKDPVLVGKSFDPTLHRPLSREEVGPNYELFDVVFIGTYEDDRYILLNELARSGVKIALFGEDKGGWKNRKLSANVSLFPSVFGEEYVKAWHWGKVALCFLRKLNRDQITQRTMEITAIGRPMVAEKTDEHDRHFQDGLEYLGFSNPSDLVEKVAYLLNSESARHNLGQRALRRCWSSKYSTQHRATYMVQMLEEGGSP